MEQVLEEPQFRVTTDERCLEPIRAPSAGSLGDHTQRPPRRDRCLLALEDVLPGGFVGDGA